MSNPTSNFLWQMPTAVDLVTDLPADFEVFGQAVDSSLADLKGGTSGQILAKNTNADMDFVWIANDQGDITAVTAGTGISGGGTSGAVTITNSMATEITAKADLIVGTGNAAFDNLAVGADGTVLTADSSVSPTGLKWATPASTSPDYQLINAGGTALTGAATITVSGISGKNDLIIIVQGVSSVNASPYITFRINSDSTSGNYQYTYQGMQSTSAIFYDYLSGTEIFSMRLGNSAADTGNGYLQIAGANATGFKPFVGIGAGKGSTTKESWGVNGVYKGTSAITSVSVLSDAGNFDAGTIFVYGA
jgi:hypothetical protein